MAKKEFLTKSMTENQFNNGYWYVDELRKFAKELEIPLVSKLRKDELEKAIKQYLRTGKGNIPTERNLNTTGIKDSEMGLSLELPINNYTNNKETKDFIVREAKKQIPKLKEKSGVRYRLNRWREEQQIIGNRITYGDLIKQYIELNQTEGGFAKIPHARYINFVSEFLKGEKNSTRSQAIEAWKRLKKLDIPKLYKEWKKLKE